MGFFRGVLGLFNKKARAEQNIENFVSLFRTLGTSTKPPVVTLYDSYMKLTSMGMVNSEWYRKPPVVNNAMAFYSCLTPPNSALALAHQINITEGNAIYHSPESDLSFEFHRMLKEVLSTDGKIDISICETKFYDNNGGNIVTHPETLLNFSISDITLKVFKEWNKDNNLAKLIP